MPSKKQLKPVNPIGRPTDYNPITQIPLMDELMRMGYWDYEVAATFDISRNVFYKWIRDYPEFQEAHEKGKADRKSVV